MGVALDIVAAEKLNVDTDVLEVVCWWHDVVLKPGTTVKIEGGKRACYSTAEYLGGHFEGSVRLDVIDAIANHEFGSSPLSIIGKILQDADKLDVLSKERFQAGMDSVEVGEYDKGRAIADLEMALSKWLPAMLERYNFDFSRKLHGEKALVTKKRFENGLKKLRSS